MKQIITILAVLALVAGSGSAALGGWPVAPYGAASNPIANVYYSTTNTNTLKSISGAKITVNATDTLDVSIMRITGTSGLFYARDAATVNVIGNWFFNGSVQAYAGIDGIASGTIVNMASIKNTSTVGVKIASDSLLITPEGGVAVLMQCKDTDSSLMRGNPVSFFGTTARGIQRSYGGICGTVYSDSIAKNGGWGYVTVSGIGYAAWEVNTSLVTGGYGVSNTKRRLKAGSNASFDEYGICAIIDTIKTVNAIGDSISRVLITRFTIPGAP